MPVICSVLLVAAETFAVGSMLLPQTTILSFVGLYLLVPTLSLLAGLLLGASSTHLLLKLLFPVVSLVGIPLGYLFTEAADGSVIDLRYLSTDLGLALIIALLPAVLGTVVGLMARAITNRQSQKSNKRSRTGTVTRTTAGRGSAMNEPPKPSGSPKLRVVTPARTGTRRASIKRTGTPRTGTGQASSRRMGTRRAGGSKRP
jgi:hypothetical protein